MRGTITQSMKENGRDHPYTLDMSKELENMYKNEKQFKAQSETKRQQLNSLKAKRENFQQQWLEAGLSNVGMKMLDLQMKQHMIIIDNIDHESENNRANLQLQVRDQVLHRMQEQIRIRDNLLNQAEEHFSKNKVKVHLDDPKLMHLEELVKINSTLPPITNNSPYGGSKNPRSQLGIIKSKFRSKLNNNTSLPPIPKNREGNHGSYFNGKRNPYQNKAYGGMYGGRIKIIGKSGISVNNRNQRASQNNGLSFHSQMRKNKHTFSTPSIKVKKRYGYKIKTANVRDSSVSKISPQHKPYLIPKTGLRNGIQLRNENERRLRSPEERKVGDSARSNDESIISTAYSNDGSKKIKFDPNNLQIAGLPLTLRKGGGRFDRTPLSRKPRNNLRNYAQQNYSVDHRTNKFNKKAVLANLNRQYRNKQL